MSLATAKPMTLPTFSTGNWYENFAATGATDRGYSLVGSGKSNTEFGMLLSSTTAAFAVLNLPTNFNLVNFEAETVVRLKAGSSAQVLQFRRLNANNRIQVSISASNTVSIARVTAGVTTTLQTLAGITATDFQRFNIKAIGSNIQVLINGILAFSIDETNFLTNSLFSLSAFDSVIGVAQAEWQYLAIKPL